jgi:membrane-associated phospholipid phosphatase
MKKQNIFLDKPKSIVPKSAWLWPLFIFILSAPLWLHTWEPHLFITLNRILNACPSSLWSFFTLIATGYCIVALSSILLVWAPYLFASWICSLPFAILLARGGKAIIESPRPAAVIGVHNIHIIGEPLFFTSMPSGHTTAAFSMATAIFFALNSSIRWYFVWIFGLAFLSGLSRIAVGAHWPGDVAVGMACGILSGMLAQYLLVHINIDAVYQNKWFRVIVSVILLGCAAKLAYSVAYGGFMLAVQRIFVVLTVLCVLFFIAKSRKSSSSTWSNF